MVMSQALVHWMIRLYRLTPARRWLLLRASAVLTAASAAVALLPFKSAIRFGLVPFGTAKVRLADLIWAIETAARYLPWRTLCIEQGLALQRMLRRGGVDALLHYGARHDHDTGKLEAHVWVSVDGRIVIGGEGAPQFAEIARYS